MRTAFKASVAGALLLGLALAGVAVAGERMPAGKAQAKKPTTKAQRREDPDRNLRLAGSILHAVFEGDEPFDGVVDLVVDTSRMSVKDVVLSRSDEDDLVAVPLGSLSFANDGPSDLELRVRMTGPSDGNRTIPAKEWKDPGQWSAVRKILRKFEPLPMSDPTGPVDGKATGSDEKMQLRKFSDLTRLDVLNPKGQDVGDVKDLLLDEVTGRIAYVIVHPEAAPDVAATPQSIRADRLTFGEKAALLDVRSGQASSTAAETLSPSLRTGETYEYHVDADPRRVDVEGWMSERPAKSDDGSGKPDPTRWTGTLAIKVKNRRTDGGCDLEIRVRQDGESHPAATYRASLSAGGEIEILERAGEGLEGASMDAMRSELQLICAKGVRGEKLGYQLRADMPAVTTSPEGRRLHYDPAESTAKRACFAVKDADGRWIGTARYDRRTGLLDSLELREESGKGTTLEIRRTGTKEE